MIEMSKELTKMINLSKLITIFAKTAAHNMISILYLRLESMFAMSLILFFYVVEAQ